MANHGHMVQPVEPLLALLERLGRDVDEVHAGAGAATLESLGEEDDLLAAAAAQLHNRPLGVAESGHDRAGVTREQFRL